MSWKLWLDRVARDLGYRRRGEFRRTARRAKAPIGKRTLQVDRLEQRTVLSADISSIVDAFNLGRQQVQTADYEGLANTVLGTDIPVVQQTLAEVLGIGDLLEQGLGNLPTLAGNQTIEQIDQVLRQAGFVWEYASLTPDGGQANGDLLRYRYDTTINLPSNLFQFDLSDFEYFNDGVDGTVNGSLTATASPINLSVTVGVDIQDNVIQFFIKEGMIVDTQGISFNGSSVNARLAIRNLIDATVTGPITGGVSGTLGLSDGDPDDKLRISQLANIVSLADGSVDASLSFDPTLTIKLPIVGTLPPILGHLSATMIDSGTPTLDVNPFVGVDFAAYANSIVGSVQGAYSSIMSVIDIFGDVDVDSTLPVIDKSLFEVLGLPAFLTGAGIGTSGSGFTNNLVSDPVTTIQKLIQGEPVDLIKFQTSGGDSTSTSYSFLIAAAVVPIGPIPLTASVSVFAGASAAYAYYLGFGVDTTGFYVDANTSISGSGSVFAGLEGSASFAGILGATVSGGVGGTLGARIGIQDPDRDGRIYLEEIVNDLNQGSGNVGDEILARMDASIFGEAYGFARGIVSFLFFDWTIFDERFAIAEFSEQLGGRSNPQDDVTDYRNVYGSGSNQRFRPLGTGKLSASLFDISTGVLTLDASHASINRASLSNSVSIEETTQGLKVTWRGVGSQTYVGVNRVNFVGGSESDRFVVKGTTNVKVHAQGLGGADYIEAGGLTSTLYGGTGSDTLVGGVSGDTIYGEDGVDDIRGNDGADYIEGGDLGDIIDGEGGNDTIHGQAGGDQINGGGDDDSIFGGTGIDVINGNGGNDWIDGGSGELATGPNGSKLVGNQISGGIGNDVIYGGSDPDVILGGLGVDLIEGQGGGDLIFGDNGEPTSGIGDNDTIKGQSGDDIIFGEGGNDTIFGDDSMAGTDGGNDLLSGDTGNDTIFGGTGQTNESGEGLDTIRGGDGNDSLLGNRGADEIYGGVGQDTLEGGAGNDRLYLDFEGVGAAAIDSLTGGVDQDILIVAGKSQLVRTDPEDPSTWVFNDIIDDVIELKQTGPNNFEVIRYATVGGAVTDSMQFTLDGSTDGDIERLGLFGLGGNDTIFTAPGVLKNLTIDGGNGHDRLTGGDGRDSIVGGEGNDSLSGGAGADVMHGDAGNDTMLGESGSDILYGGANDDRIDGGVGRDRAYGEDGADLLMAGDEILGDNLDGGPGADTLIGGMGLDKLIGGTEGDLLIGGDLIDNLDGGAGNDTLVGEQGRDDLRGGAENDVMHAYIANQFRNQVAASAGIVLPAVVPLTEAEINQKRDFEVKPIKDVLELVVQKINASFLYSPANFATLSALLAQTTLSNENWQTLGQILYSSGVLSASEWSAFQLRVLDPDIDAGATVEQRVQTWTDYFVQVYSDLLDQSLLNPDDLEGGDGNDQLTGSPFSDNIAGEVGNDTIFHSSGNDTVSGGESARDNDIYAFEGTEQDDTMVASLASSGGGNLVGVVTFGNQPPINGTLNGNTLDEIDIESLGVFGHGGKDTITVHFRNQATYLIYIDGGDGNDSIDASPVDGLPLQAKATLIGGSGNDTIIGGLSDDLIIGGPDDNRDGNSDDVISPLTDDDILDGNVGNDTIHGGSGDDLFIGGRGNDNFIGGSGTDLITEHIVDDPTAGWRVDITDNQVIGGKYDPILQVLVDPYGDDSITIDVEGLAGTSNSDNMDATTRTYPTIIWGLDGNDSLVGGSNGDYLDGGDGNDLINGSAGNDTMYGSHGNDSIFGGVAHNNNSFDGDDYLNGQGGNDTLDSGLGLDTVVGGLGNDYIDEYSYGSPRSQYYVNYIFGDLGPDPNQSTTFTEAGLDPYLHVGDGDSLLRGDIGQDFIVGGGGDDRELYGGFGDGSDSLWGGDGDDVVMSNGGYGNPYSISVVGLGDPDNYYGNDFISGGQGNDQLIGSRGNDTVDGGSGNDSIAGFPGQDTIYGGSGNDTIHEHTNNGTSWTNWIDTGSGDDTVRGDAGNDTILGGSGDDELSGGFDGPTNDIIDAGTGRNKVRNSEFEAWSNVWFNTPPTVITGAVVDVVEGVDWIFSAAGSYDPDGDPLFSYSVDINFEGIHRVFTSPTSTITVPRSAIADVADGGRTWAATVSVQDENYEYNGTGTAAVTINAINVEPSLSIAVPMSSVRGEPVNFALLAIDPSGIDQAAGFMFEIDWDGNGIFDEMVNGLSGLIVSQAFDTSGMKTVKVRATDQDGGVSQVVSHSINIQDWALRANPQDPLKTDLYWGGTIGADHYIFESIDSNTVQVRDGQTNAILQTLNTVNGGIYAYAGKGNDTLVGSTRGDYLNGGDGNDTIYGDVVTPPQGATYGSDTIIGSEGDDILYGDGDGGEGAADVIYGDAGNDTIFGDGNLGDATGADTIFGGAGNDTITADPDGGEGAADSVQGEAGDDFIKAGGGNDVVLGGDGDDILLGGDGAEGASDSLVGGDGRDIVVGDGGSETVKIKVGGADTLRGGTGQDILIAGLGLPSVANPLDFIAIRSEWTSGQTIAERIANITGPGSASRANGNNYLTPGITVYNDKPATGGATLVDQVFGGADEDWIFSDLPEDNEADLDGSDILVDFSLFPRPE